MKQFFVVGITHVDLAWKRGRAEMAEMLEIVVVRLLDLLESEPDFCYHIEQAAHFRALQKSRPDLVARLAPFLQSGRLEFVGGLASTLEANLPNGECFVRNQQIGLDWVADTWGESVRVRTGWLVDAFGVPAQTAQILRGFGIEQFMACRFGGNHTHDVFTARALDGSTVTVAGWGTYSAYIKPETVSERFCKNWDDVDACFAKADALTGVSPFLVAPYTENEMLVSRYPHTVTKQRDRERTDERWRSATPAQFFDALHETGRVLPVVDGDLNPEFTGCFSLRHPIRLLNRRVETRLLEAEKWAALSGQPEAFAARLAEAWWEMAFVQFHDVFTGSHPTVVFHDVMRVLRGVEADADAVLNEAFAAIAPPAGATLSDTEAVAVVFNGLPWHRHDVAEVALPSGFAGVAKVTGSAGELLPFAVDGEIVRVAVPVPATGFCAIRLTAGAVRQPEWTPANAAVLENDAIRMDFDTTEGIARLVSKASGRTLLANAGNFLVAQADNGNFQIENPASGEVPARSGTLQLETGEASALGQTVRLSGAFPTLSWADADNHLRFVAEFFLSKGNSTVQVRLRLDWKGERTRVRLCLPTTIDSATGIYETPFGVARRKAYTPRTNAKGEWPAHRFVAIEDGAGGIGLINTGTGGVEVLGGSLYTTLLRAPKAEYAGMIADESSSQHGTHEYTFVLAPYAETWEIGGVVAAAQEANNPLHVRFTGDERTQPNSYLAVAPQNIVLSGVKAATDGSGDVVIRLYETTGQPTDATLTFGAAWTAHGAVWECDLRENKTAPVQIADGSNAMTVSFAPFEIRTVRFARAPV